MSASCIRRSIHPQIRVIDNAHGICEYIASDQTLDSYRELILSSGWRFNHFEKNAPLVDSHKYDSIQTVLGRVIHAEVRNGQLRERVQWAVDVPENTLAQVGWKMTASGYLRAVSVGFIPTRSITRSSDPQEFADTLRQVGLPDDANVRCIYTEQEQIELSACVIGANPNALVAARRAGVISRCEMDLLTATPSKYRAVHRFEWDPVAKLELALRFRQAMK